MLTFVYIVDTDASDNATANTYCYVMQAVVCVNCLGDKCLLHAKQMGTALTQLLVFRFSYLLMNKG